MEDAASDWTDPPGSVDGMTEMGDSDLLLQPIASDALAQLSVTDPVDESPEEASWDQNVGMALEEILAQNKNGQLMGTVEVSAHVKELLKKGEVAKGHLSALNKEIDEKTWSLELQERLGESLGVMNEFVAEMRENCHDFRTCSSWSSASSGGSLCAQKDQTLLLLLRVLQELYAETTSSCLLAIQQLETGFRQETDTAVIGKTGFQQALRTISLLRQIIDFEVMMCDDGIGPTKILKREDVMLRKEGCLASMVLAMNERVCRIQVSVLQEDTGAASVDKEELSCTLQECWNGLKDVTYRVSSCHPMLKQKLYSHLLDTFTQGVHLLRTIQDTEETQNVMLRMQTVISEVDNPEVYMSDEEVATHEWLLPCLRKLRSVSSDVAKQICKSRSFKDLVGADPLCELRQEFIELILVSTARMIRLTQPSETFELPQIEKRKDHGLKMLQLLSRYDGSCLSTNFEGSEVYDLFEKLTTRLLNNILCFQTKLQLNEFVGHQVPAHEVSLSSSGELTSLHSKELAGCMQFPLNTLSGEASGSTRIGTVPTDSQAPEASTFTGDTSIEMPNPFRNAHHDSSIEMPTNFWGTDARRASQEQTQSSINGASSSVPIHPLSRVSTASLPERLSSEDCPGMEHFYTINKQELVYGPRLGSGSTGQVFKMFYRGSPVAVKIMNYPRLLATQERLVHESEMHRRLAHHPNIVQFYGQCVGVDDSQRAVGLVMELCDIGSLLELIREARCIRRIEREGHDMERYKKCVGYAFLTDWRLRMKMACDVASGMEFLQSRAIVHRDLTSYNVVISHGGKQGNMWTAKVCDFERSRHVPSGTNIPRSDNIANSPAWSAPEVLRNDDYSTQADVFSMGVILWEIVTLGVPWKEALVFEQVIRYVSEEHLRLELPPPDDTCPLEYPQLVALIQDAWKDNPEERPTMREFHQRIFDIQKEFVHRIRRETQAS